MSAPPDRASDDPLTSPPRVEGVSASDGLASPARAVPLSRPAQATHPGDGVGDLREILGRRRNAGETPAGSARARSESHRIDAVVNHGHPARHRVDSQSADEAPVPSERKRDLLSCGHSSSESGSESQRADKNAIATQRPSRADDAKRKSVVQVPLSPRSPHGPDNEFIPKRGKGRERNTKGDAISGDREKPRSSTPSPPISPQRKRESTIANPRLSDEEREKLDNALVQVDSPSDALEGRRKGLTGRVRGGEANGRDDRKTDRISPERAGVSRYEVHEDAGNLERGRDRDRDDSRERRRRRRRRRRRDSDYEDERDRRRREYDDDDEVREYRRHRRKRRRRSYSRSRSPPRRSLSEEQERERRKEDRRARRRERERRREAEREERRKARRSEHGRERSPDTSELFSDEAGDSHRERRADRQVDYDDIERRRSRRRRRRYEEGRRSDVDSADGFEHGVRGRYRDHDMLSRYRRDGPSFRRDQHGHGDESKYGRSLKGVAYSDDDIRPDDINFKREPRHHMRRSGRGETLGRHRTRETPQGGEMKTSDPRNNYERRDHILPLREQARLDERRRHESHFAQNADRSHPENDRGDRTHVPATEAGSEHRQSSSRRDGAHELSLRGREKPSREAMQRTPWDAGREEEIGRPKNRTSVKEEVQAKTNTLKLDVLRSRAMASMKKSAPAETNSAAAVNPGD